MRTLISTVLVVFVLAAAASSQTVTCNLAIDKAPAVRSLRLGMEQNEVVPILGKRFEKGLLDEYTESLSVSFRGDRSGFEGIKYIRLDAYNEKVSRIDVVYDVIWKDIQEYIANFSPKLGLPVNGWNVANFDARMTCEDFEVRLSSVGLNEGTMSLIDTRVVRAIEAAKAAAVDAKKKEIKP